jgi:hypothetical protein
LRSIIIAAALAILVLNAVMYPYYWTESTADDEWKEGNGDDDIIVPIDAITVQVPKKRSGDVLQYDYDFFGEIYAKNRTSGNWSRITLEANGQMRESYPGISSQTDGFNQPHQTWQWSSDIRLSLVITIEEYSPGEENEPFILSGSIDGSRKKYSTLNGNIPILNYAGGLLKVDEISSVEAQIPEFEFSIDAWTYPDLSITPERPLEERLYGQQNALNEGMNGSYGETQEDWGNYTQWYNWTVETSERVRGYDCTRLNITSDFFGFFYLSKILWLSNDVPAPVRASYVSITRWNEPEEFGHIVLTTNQTLVKQGYQQGSSVININHNGKETFLSRHPSGAYNSWEVGPKDGSLSTTSFEFGLQEALDHAMANSEDLQEWLRTHPSPIITEAGYFEKDTDQLNMDQFVWNITLADEPGNWEDWDLWYSTNAYEINVSKFIERRPILGDLVTYEIDPEERAWYGYAVVPEEDLASGLVTLASSERIWSQLSRVSSRVYSGVEQKVDFADARYFITMGGISPAGFGMDLLDTLTGVSIPTTNYTWALQYGNVWEGASTFMVGVDVETGRVIFITDISGPQALSLIFGAD